MLCRRPGNIEEAAQGHLDDLARGDVLCFGPGLHRLPKIGVEVNRR
jgi:hypothetical protein